MANTTAALAAASRLITAKFDLRSAAASPYYPKMAYVVRSTAAEEKYAFLGTFPGMREWLGDRIFKQLLAADYELKNKHWESSLLIAKTDVDDARILRYDFAIDGLAQEAMYHPDELLFSIMVAGDATVGWDGQYFYDTDHSFGDSGSQSNDLTYAAASGTTPTTAEFRASYNAAYAAMLAFKGDNGKPLFRPTQAQQVTQPLVQVPPALYPTAYEALSVEEYDTDGNPVLVLGNPVVESIAYLTDATEWYLHNVAGALKPFIFQEREPLKRQVKGADDLETKDLKLMTEARYNAGYGAWWNSVLTTFT